MEDFVVMKRFQAVRSQSIRSMSTRSQMKVIGKLLLYPAVNSGADKLLEDALVRISDVEMSELLRVYMNFKQTLSSEQFWRMYVDAFEFSSESSLYLADLLPASERDNLRSRLTGVYVRTGFTWHMHEFPDYLPLVLDFVASSPRAQATAVLTELQPALRRLYDILRGAENAYAPLIRACLLLSERFLAPVTSSQEPQLHAVAK
ncbi:hypothetical protein LLE49_16805 [Alicyclobacillus tolerans]|uniref:hypothetical protein n=1 Tax=Alicyclobacillus tolerans TaxID=90970 RepID=UPI001F293430|nr:hypothetical protein [Alicyclobacillus tolerans]MCF8566384.1 hypothetical protein [Alicyclobacillus tolerans]